MEEFGPKEEVGECGSYISLFFSLGFLSVVPTIFFLQFAIRTSKASRPRRTPGTALPVRKAARVQAVTCLAQLAIPRQAGNTQGEVATALDLHSPAVTGPPPTTQSPSTNKYENFLSQ